MTFYDTLSKVSGHYCFFSGFLYEPITELSICSVLDALSPSKYAIFWTISKF